jgi:hypothetical protein
LGANAYSTSLVVMLDDGGDLETRTLALGARKATFEGVATGTEVTVQMAIVVDTAEGDYLISDILETSIHQSLTEPAFSRAWRRITAIGDSDATASGVQLHEGADGNPFLSKALKVGRMYYVGYNENFGNYKSSDDALVTTPVTARLRIGLAHADQETDGARDDVDFKAYILRIVDADGDVVAEGDDVATVESRYGGRDRTYDHDGDTNTANKPFLLPFNLFLYGPASGSPATFDDEDKVGGYALSNVRIVDGSDITPAAHHNDAVPAADPGTLIPNYLSRVAVDSFGVNTSTATGVVGALPAVNEVYARPPDEHRDFPLDTLASDETYTISAWAVNDDDEVISPVAKLKVRPKDTHRGAVTDFKDYRAPDADGNGTRDPYALDDLTTTAFTVLK